MLIHQYLLMIQNKTMGTAIHRMNEMKQTDEKLKNTEGSRRDLVNSPLQSQTDPSTNVIFYGSSSVRSGLKSIAFYEIHLQILSSIQPMDKTHQQGFDWDLMNRWISCLLDCQRNTYQKIIVDHGIQVHLEKILIGCTIRIYHLKGQHIPDMQLDVPT